MSNIVFNRNFYQEKKTHTQLSKWERGDFKDGVPIFVASSIPVAVSIRMALGMPTIGFSENYSKTDFFNLKEKYPNSQIIVENGFWQKNNDNKSLIEDIQESYDCLIVCPKRVEEFNDFNILAMQKGLAEVRKQITEQLPLVVRSLIFRSTEKKNRKTAATIN